MCICQPLSFVLGSCYCGLVFLSACAQHWGPRWSQLCFWDCRELVETRWQKIAGNTLLFQSLPHPGPWHKHMAYWHHPLGSHQGPCFCQSMRFWCWGDRIVGGMLLPMSYHSFVPITHVHRHKLKDSSQLLTGISIVCFFMGFLSASIPHRCHFAICVAKSHLMPACTGPFSDLGGRSVESKRWAGSNCWHHYCCLSACHIHGNSLLILCLPRTLMKVGDELCADIELQPYLSLQPCAAMVLRGSPQGWGEVVIFLSAQLYAGSEMDWQGMNTQMVTWSSPRNGKQKLHPQIWFSIKIFFWLGVELKI